MIQLMPVGPELFALVQLPRVMVKQLIAMIEVDVYHIIVYKAMLDAAAKHNAIIDSPCH
jgi:hypothetical protein